MSARLRSWMCKLPPSARLGLLILAGSAAADAQPPKGLRARQAHPIAGLPGSP